MWIEGSLKGSLPQLQIWTVEYCRKTTFFPGPSEEKILRSKKSACGAAGGEMALTVLGLAGMSILGFGEKVPIMMTDAT